MRLLRIPEPFDHPDFIFEPKIDGFRALAFVEGHHCRLVSRAGYVFTGWPQLAEETAHAIRAHSAVIDGEICCLAPDGRTRFHDLLFRREWRYFYAFDVLAIDGEDLTSRPLTERKRRLRAIMPIIDCRLLYLDSIAERGTDLYHAACDRDLEGIVAKWTRGVYQADGRGTSWLKIKNARYTQAAGRRELFEHRREGPRRHQLSGPPILRLT
jgi:bifunctional non-homologous end joining protein LigD